MWGVEVGREFSPPRVMKMKERRKVFHNSDASNTVSTQLPSHPEGDEERKWIVFDCCCCGGLLFLVSEPPPPIPIIFFPRGFFFL